MEASGKLTPNAIGAGKLRLAAMSNQTHSLKTVFASVRTPRVVLLVDRAEAEWEMTCSRLIETFSFIWGGMHFLIIPSDGTSIAPPFWRLLDKYDPDYVTYYQKSGWDYKLGHPEEFEAFIETQLARPEFRSDDPIAQRAHIEKAALESLNSGFSVSPELDAHLTMRLARFHHSNRHDVLGPLAYSPFVSYLLTGLPEIISNGNLPRRVAEVAAPLGIPKLWISSVTGMLPLHSRDTLAQLGFVFDSFSLEVDQTVDLVFGVSKLAVQQWLPAALSMFSLSRYQSTRADVWDQAILVVVGDTIDDFCWYYSVSRMRNSVFWLPTALTQISDTGVVLDKPLTSIALTLVRLSMQAGGRKIHFVSWSLPRPSLDKLSDGLNELSFGRITPVAEFPDVTTIELGEPLIAFNRENVDAPVLCHFLDDQMAGGFPTPKPRGFVNVPPTGHRWIADLRIDREQFPRHPALGASIVSHPQINSTSARVGAYGIAYSCPHNAYFGGDLESVLVRPILSTPTASEVLFRLLKSNGWTCRTSDKGSYAKDFVEKLRSLTECAAILRDPFYRQVFAKYLAAPQLPSNDVNGIRLDRRRYLSLQPIVNVCGGDDDEAAGLLDRLTMAGILHRGLILKCHFCRNAGWYALGELGEGFVCKRCRRFQKMQHESWRQPAEPSWYYELDEIAYQVFTNNCHVPLLTLDCLRRGSQSFLFDHEEEISESDGTLWMECDVYCIADGKTIVGEAKTGDCLGNTGAEELRSLSKYLRLAQGIGARSIVLATTANAWSSATKNRVQDALRGTDISPVFLNSSNLFPP